MLDNPSLPALLLIAPLLIYAGYSDLRLLKIPNWISLAMLAASVVFLPMLPGSEIGARAVAAIVIFGIGFVLFALNTLGAGDVKMLTALMLFVPSGMLQVFLLMLSVALLVSIGLITVARWHPLPAVQHWHSIATPRSLPMGVAISAAGLGLIPVLF